MKEKENPVVGYVVLWFLIAMILSLFVQGLKYFIYLESAYHDQFYVALGTVAAIVTAIFVYKEGAQKKVVQTEAIPVKVDKVTPAPKSDIPNRYEQQLAALVAVGSISSRSIISGEEWDCFYAAKNVLRDYNNYHVHAQACLGEYLKASDPRGYIWSGAFGAINSKRADFLICNNKGMPVLVIEYQGTGHDLGEDSDKRNAVKHLALQRAGIPVLEIFPEHQKSEIEQLIRKCLS